MAILHFPNLDVLRLALTSGVVPESVRTAPVRFALADDQSLWLTPAGALTAAAHKELRKLGVKTMTTSPLELVHEADHWLQVFPITRDPRGVELSDKTPVLFELARTDQLAEVATEILRLGNDRQSFRWLEGDGVAKGLLRVVGPPYYSLLRSLDRNGVDAAPIAYRETAPGVWIQIGFTHPLAEQLHPPTGQWLLLRAPSQWTYVPETKLRDIYEVIDFQLPEATSAYQDVELSEHIRVPVKLTRSGVADTAELWLLGEAGIAHLEDFVRSSDNELLARLAFAIGEKDGTRIVVVRIRPSKSVPPVLVLDGIAFRSYLRIPNLFTPVGMALHPPLRRDAVIRLLAEDKSRITWLHPHVDATFTPESLPDDAFRPMPEWVDYVLEHDHQAMTTWLGATQFQFEGFICKDDVDKEKKPPKPPAAPKEPKKPSEKDDAGKPARESAGIEKKKTRKADADAENETKVEPGELEKRLRELEHAYSGLQTPLEDPERQVIWRQLAEVNGALNQPGDAAVCWGNALWELPSVPPDWPSAWLQHESKQAVSLAQILRVVESDVIAHGQARFVMAYLIGAAAAPPTDALRPHLGKLQQYLEKYEGLLGVRVLWLAWHALHRLSGGDVLTLARARDRLLERLYLQGLTPDLDLPGFLRFTGLQANNRFRIVRDEIVRLRQNVQDWAKTGNMLTPATHAYIDLIFAFGLARLGENNEARNLLRDAGKELVNADEVHSWLYAAFAYRVQQALDGKPALDRLPDRMLTQLDEIEHPDFLEHVSEPKQLQELKDVQRFLRLKIDRMREKSRILEPFERRNAYSRWHGRFADELTRELADLADQHDRAVLMQRLRQLMKGKQKFKGAPKPEARILTTALELAPRLGQAFGEEVLARVPAQLVKGKEVEESALLLEKGLLLAGHLDRREDVHNLVGEFLKLLEGSKTPPYECLTPLFAGSFRMLRKFGLRDLVPHVLERVEAIVNADQALRAAAWPTMASDSLAKRLGLLLEIAAGRLFFGEEAKARVILDEAHDILIGKKLLTVDHVKVGCAYLTALGQAPMEFALERCHEFFGKVEGVYDNYTTTTHYSLSRFNVVEAMMLALVSDDFTLDPQARKRLDDDEYLVRRRIHRDVREAMAQAGM